MSTTHVPVSRTDLAELEIDLGAVVSKGGDHGAYVMAWLWIGDDEADIATGGAS